MKASFKAFMGNLIDYAGLFPPANLSLDRAFKNYINYKQESDAWILANFICPVHLLEQLIPYRHTLQEKNQEISITVLPAVVEMRSNYSSIFEKNIQDIADFLSKMKKNARIDAMEIRIFPTLLNQETHPALHHFLAGLGETLISAGIEGVKLFFELQQSAGWIDSVKEFTEQIALFNQSMAENKKLTTMRPAGLKLRCGGERPENIPSLDEVSNTIRSCVVSGIPFKATAGLHHPLRHFDNDLNTTVHGFFNIFGAALLAYQHQLTVSEIQSVIAEKDPAQFLFDDNSFRHKEWRMDLNQIISLRNNRVISFGSCSIDEPRQDLIQLDLLK
jgi:hypothetical protein